MKTEINKFIDGLEEIFADLRERHVDDSVCGLCEYDGAFMGQSGDWCNECPGFDKDDCFKLSDETRKKWIEEIVNAYPDHTADIGKKASVSCDHEKDHTADIGKKVSISCGQENDLISRQAAIDALDKRFDDVPMELTTEILQLRHDLRERIPSAQPATNCSEIPNGSDDTISRQAAIDAIEKAKTAKAPDGEVYVAKINAEMNIQLLPSARPEQRWAPVTERLPENDNEVLITVWDAEDDYVEVYKGFYQGHEWWTQWCHGCSKIKDEPCGENIVIAWRPLPEPYRGGGKE